jgi:drug/metabolite transporter (DMT)-like permease
MCSIQYMVTPTSSETVLKPVYTFETYLVILLAAFLTASQGATLTYSMRYNSVGMIQVINYLAIPLGFFLDWLIIG